MWQEIKEAYKKANITEKIIYINSILFLFTALFTNFMVNWFALPANYENFFTKPWTMLSYAFIHERFLHLISNLIILYYIGNLFLDFYTKKKFINFYFITILLAGFTFLTVNYFKPSYTLPLGGASAAITAIFVGLATKVPRYAIRFRFIGSIELWLLATIWVSISILQLSAINKGSAIAHLTGAIFGFVYAQQLEKGNDIGKWFESSLNYFANFSIKKRKTPLRKVHKTTFSKKTNIEKNKQAKINDILDKISKSGYDSLTKEEKDFLFRAGQK